MTTGFQQQDNLFRACFPKQAASPQHGQKAPRTPLPVREPRTYQPRPGH